MGKLVLVLVLACVGLGCAARSAPPGPPVPDGYRVVSVLVPAHLAGHGPRLGRPLPGGYGQRYVYHAVVPYICPGELGPTCVPCALGECDPPRRPRLVPMRPVELADTTTMYCPVSDDCDCEVCAHGAAGCTPTCARSCEASCVPATIR